VFESRSIRDFIPARVAFLVRLSWRIYAVQVVLAHLRLPACGVPIIGYSVLSTAISRSRMAIKVYRDW